MTEEKFKFNDISYKDDRIVAEDRKEKVAEKKKINVI